MEKPFLLNNYKLDEASLKKVFLHNLNELYPILLNLSAVLPQFALATCFGDLQNVIEELLFELEIQIDRVDEVFLSLKEVPLCCKNLSENYVLQNPIPDLENDLMTDLTKDLLLIFAIQKNIAVKTNYFNILKSIANSLNDINIKENIQHCYNECEENTLLFKLIAKEYSENNINSYIH